MSSTTSRKAPQGVKYLAYSSAVKTPTASHNVSTIEKREKENDLKRRQRKLSTEKYIRRPESATTIDRAAHSIAAWATLYVCVDGHSD